MAYKIIYTSDLHGHRELYKLLLNKAESENTRAIVIGGDLCPMRGSSFQEKIEHQKFFLGEFLIPLFKEFKGKNRKNELYLIMGNDDFRVNLNILEDADKNGVLKSKHKKSLMLDNGYCIAGYSFVNPTPFRLKDWEKPDLEGEKPPQQLFNEEIRTMEAEQGTIQQDLEELRKLSNPKKTIYVVHAPPYNSKLDMVGSGIHVGSKAVRNFIEKEQPRMTLHGHIHESPKMSGSWMDKIGKAVCINVGSNIPKERLNCVVINADNLDDIRYFELE